MEGTQKQGMSKGCLVAIIVAAVVLVIIIIGGIICYSYKDELLKTGAVTLVGQAKTKLANNPPEGVDTVQFNALADAFMGKLDETEVEFEQMGVKVQEMQVIAQKDTLDVDDVEQFENIMIDLFPELEELRYDYMEEMLEEDTVTADSM